MKGYIGNEEATKAAIDEDGWYHSGDLGYYDEDERIYIVDRIKEVIKFRNLQVIITHWNLEIIKPTWCLIVFLKILDFACRSRSFYRVYSWC